MPKPRRCYCLTYHIFYLSRSTCKIFRVHRLFIILTICPAQFYFNVVIMASGTPIFSLLCYLGFDPIHWRPTLTFPWYAGLIVFDLFSFWLKSITEKTHCFNLFDKMPEHQNPGFGTLHPPHKRSKHQLLDDRWPLKFYYSWINAENLKMLKTRTKNC